MEDGPAKPEGKRLQMADLAKLAGVSKATVSRALADSPLINVETRRRIQALAREHHYQVNLGARNLRLGLNQTIAVVVPFEGERHQQLSDPFFRGMIGALADELVRRDFDSGRSQVMSGCWFRVARWQALQVPQGRRGSPPGERPAGRWQTRVAARSRAASSSTVGSSPTWNVPTTLTPGGRGGSVAACRFRISVVTGPGPGSGCGTPHRTSSPTANAAAFAS